jgi:multidrug efflux pump subunit AcrB
MKISTRLGLAGLFSAAIVALMGAVLLLAIQQVRQELVKNETAGEIVNAVSALRYLTLEYTLRNEERVQTQWQLKHASLTQLLASSTGFDGTEEQAIMDQLRQTLETLHTLFAELLSSYQGRITDSGRSALLEELEARLTGQVMNRTQDMITDALMLANRSRAAVAGAQERAGLAIIAFGGYSCWSSGSPFSWPSEAFPGRWRNCSRVPQSWVRGISITAWVSRRKTKSAICRAPSTG